MKFYTYKKQVPLKPGERLGYQRGKGYYVIPAPKPVPPVVPRVASPFAGKGLFCTSEPGVVEGHPCDWVALQADPEGNLVPPKTSARIMWWQARADQGCADACNLSSRPYIGQAENQAELDKCLALHLTVPKALVGNAGSWTAVGREEAAQDGWDLIQEWYKNAHPWEASPDAANYKRFVNVCYGIYSEGEPGGQGYVQQIPLSDYRAVWHGSFSVWKAEAMTPADWAVFAA